jgi:hypothetical protein
VKVWGESSKVKWSEVKWSEVMGGEEKKIVARM